MSVREALFVTALAVGLTLIVAGTAILSQPAAFIVAGLGLIAIAMVVLTEVG